VIRREVGAADIPGKQSVARENRFRFGGRCQFLMARNEVVVARGSDDVLDFQTEALSGWPF
jgi:hypothetical protein